MVLQAASQDRLREILADPSFRQLIDDLGTARREATTAPAWFQRAHPGAPHSGTGHSGTGLSCVAYFSMEFMLSEGLPIYSSGLGTVAGDQLKAASDLGVPVIGVGLLYQQGYFRQEIDAEGAQQAIYPYSDPGQLPITPLRLPSGEWVRLKLNLPGYPIWLRAWQAQVGRVKLYLLDSNDAANFPLYRGITAELYGGGPYVRLMQELTLGIGSWQMLEALGISPDVCHLNEGHAVLAVLERARSFMQASGQNFETALAATRAGNLFTTHTAVAAGFDRFPPALIERCLGDYARGQLGVTLHDFLALGRQDPNNGDEDFNMAYLALRGCGAANAVSKLHGEVSRSLFAPLFPRWPVAEVPIGYVTNGVHVPTWDSDLADALWTDACGRDRWAGTMDLLADGIRCVQHLLGRDDIVIGARHQIGGASNRAKVQFPAKPDEFSLRQPVFNEQLLSGLKIPAARQIDRIFVPAGEGLFLGNIDRIVDMLVEIDVILDVVLCGVQVFPPLQHEFSFHQPPAHFDQFLIERDRMFVDHPLDRAIAGIRVDRRARQHQRIHLVGKTRRQHAGHPATQPPSHPATRPP